MSENLPNEKVEKIERIEGIGSSSPTKIADDVAQQNHEADIKVKFDQALARADTSPPTTEVTTPPPVAPPEASTAAKPTPMVAASQFQGTVQRLQPVTLDSIVQQANNAHQQIRRNIGAIQELPESVQKVAPPVPRGDVARATDHLIHIDSSLQSLTNKVGVEVTAQSLQQAQQAAQSPLVKFLGYLSHSDYQLSNLISQVNELNSKRERMQPGDLMAIQIKVSFVQQEVELFSNILNQALTAIKTVMNVQV